MPSKPPVDSQTETSAPMREPKPKFPAQKQDPPGLERDLDPQPKWRAERYRAANKLEGQRALITGGDSGIGRSVAYLFAREGADVAIVCLPEEKADAEEVREAIEELGRRCIVMYEDLSERDACDRVIEKTVEELGGLDCLVHNAAWQNRKSIEDLSEDELDRTMRVNVYAYLRLARGAVPHMKPGATIIATGSVVGLSGSERLSDYGATKGAIHSITKCLAAELVEKQIRVNCVAPGPVWTPLNPSDTGLSAEEVAEFGRETGSSPMERPAQPEELAPAYVFFASNADSSYITGAVLPVTGGPE
jgi:NAD(P)-dependent dehydrogenase (short-subunit alcohol dehydrogenase family)